MMSRPKQEVVMVRNKTMEPGVSVGRMLGVHRNIHYFTVNGPTKIAFDNNNKWELLLIVSVERQLPGRISFPDATPGCCETAYVYMRNASSLSIRVD